MKKVSKVLKIILSVALTVVLLYLAFRKVEWKVFWDDLATTRWFFIFLSMAAAIVALIFRAERWHLMLMPLDTSIKRVKVWDGSNFGNLASVAMPGIGEFIRCGAVCTKKASYDKVLGTCFVERVWDVIAVCIVMVAALCIQTDTLKPFFIEKIAQPVEARLHLSLWWLFVIIILLGILAVFLVYKLRSRSKALDKLAGWFDGMFSGIKSFKDIEHKWLFLLYSAGIWVMYILINFFAFKAIPAISHLSFTDALFVSAAGNVASVVPTPLGMGAFHYLVALTLSVPFGSTWEIGILFATLTHESRAILLIVTGLLSMLHAASDKKTILDK